MIGSRILHGICHSRLQLAMRWSNKKSYHLHSFGILPYQRCQQEKKNRCVDASENFQQTQGPSCPCLLFLPNSLFLFWWLRFFMALTLAFTQLEVFQICSILLAIFRHLLEWGQDCLLLETFLMSTGVKWTQGLFFWNTFCRNFGTELSQDTPKVLSVVWAFPIVE